MNVFISYASEDRETAEQIQIALVGSGHRVFFDKASLPEGDDYHDKIRKAIEQSDLFVCLIGASSVSAGSYALTELKFARLKWPHPKGRVLPVVLKGADRERIPNYLNAATWLEPEGNIGAEVLAAVGRMAKTWSLRARRLFAPTLLLVLVALAIAGGVIWWQACPSYSGSGPLNGHWRYSMTSEISGVQQLGELELTMEGPLVAGSFKRMPDDSKRCVSGKFFQGILELSRPTGPVKGVAGTIQKYRLGKQGDNKFVGEFVNEGGWPDRGRIELER
jgi:hypothetical protein